MTDQATDLKDAAMEEEESHFVCNLGAIDAKQRRRYEALTAEMRAAAQEVEELPDGYAIRFPSDRHIHSAVGEWITLERLCCPFLRFALETDGEGRHTWLRLTGREGVKNFLRSEIGLA